MNCSQCQEYLTAYLEGLLDIPLNREVAQHLETCEACTAIADEQRRLGECLIESARSLADPALGNAVMNRITARQTTYQRRIAMRKRYERIGLGLAAAAAIAAVLFIPWGGTTRTQATADEVFAMAVEAVSQLESVYIRLNTRTLARDNFELIGLDYDFVPHEMWKRFGHPPQWRVEKPGRLVVMDGEASLLLVGKAESGASPDMASKGGPDTGFVGWLQRLLDVDQLLEGEVNLAERMGWEMKINEEKGADGVPKLIVTIEAEAQGDYVNDWLKNKSISASDHRRVYVFDAKTMLLEDLEVWVHTDARDVLVLDIVKIAYNQITAPDLFTLAVPEDVIWFEQPQPEPGDEAYTEMSADEAARAFFQACADEDWPEAVKFLPVSELPEVYSKMFGGLEIIHIGEPFKSGQYRGWFVPYEIRMKSGEVRKFNLAVRNDNPARRFIVDGGL